MEPKKRSLAAAERDEFLRAAWRALVAEEVDDAKRLVFVDEMGANDDVVNAYVALTEMQSSREPGFGLRLLPWQQHLRCFFFPI